MKFTTKILNRLITVNRRAILAFADIIAPTDPNVRIVEKMNPDDFVRFLQTTSRQIAPPRPTDGVIAMFPYRIDLLRIALVELKDRLNRRLSNNIGAALFAELSQKISAGGGHSIERPIVIPVPISKNKRRERGWNQCDLILDGLAKADLHGQFEIKKNLVEKVRDTDDQVGKSKIERAENLRGCFVVCDRNHEMDSLKNRHIIVVDDIVTTGATLGEVKKALVAAGFEKILLIAVAH